ncbi:MAG: hypothetical protein U5K43_06540 [Halofilum sp. (in: g-proteobacteria)]|nr:hypothetical protein [Halofilum sp. (in: g-proteobacteria)]
MTTPPGDPAEGETAPLRLERFVPYRLATLADSVSRTLAATYEARFGICHSRVAHPRAPRSRRHLGR